MKKLDNKDKKDNLIKLMAIICKHECNKETEGDYLKKNCQLACFGDTFKKLSSLDNKVHKVLKLYISNRVETNCDEKKENFVADMIKDPFKIHMIKNGPSEKGDICNEDKSIPNMSSVAEVKLRNINKENLDELKNKLIDNGIDTLCDLIKLLKNIFPEKSLQLDLTLMYVMIYDNIKKKSTNEKNYFNEFKKNDNKVLTVNGI